MITKTIKGNLLDAFDRGYVDVIAHQCNCFCNMGSGIAPQIAKRYPNVSKADQKTREGDASKLGTFTKAWVNHGHSKGIVYNLYGQFRYGGQRMQTNYDALAAALKAMQNDLIKLGKADCIVGLPLIGCGLGGGDWEVVSEIINEVFTNEVHIYVL